MDLLKIGHFLLMVNIIAVTASGQGGSTLTGNCQNAYQVDTAFFDCLRSSRQRSSLTSFRPEFNEGVKTGILNLLQAFCTEVLQPTKECFLEKIENCEEPTYGQLSEAANSTDGYVCQSDGSGIHPAVQEVLSLISEEEMTQAAQGTCPGVQTRICVNEAISSSGLGSSERTTDTLLSLAPRADEAYARCLFRIYGEQADSCSFWRSEALLKIGGSLLPGSLASRLPFTAQQIKDMLQL